MKILLDFDGVMVTTPTWQTVAQADDDFMQFNPVCAQHLAQLLTELQNLTFVESGAMGSPLIEIVLTTTHRIHYDNKTWLQLLNNRGIYPAKVSKINDAKTFNELENRRDEIMVWVNNHPNDAFVIIDDDSSLRSLPASLKIKWVETQFHQGFTQEAKDKALKILLSDF